MAAVPGIPTGHLDLYEPLDIIGNGSFGIIRKVRRKSDGEILARKELNFERMSERDRRQIVAEVNILKDLHHDNIVKYIDRFVDRDAGILYILMEYCDGGDLSSIIKQCSRSGRALPEDTVWSYFYQLLLALHHCHSPNSGSEDSESRRQQILHRDLKPENVFLSSSGGSMVKLGDFGLSKALNQTSFAMTYVGTPYYMSPELIQEKSYDTKSDIWSLGCLIYELCAHKPPFAEAQTHSELSMLIRNGRIPPLPKGYSHALTNVIKAMLNLNPAMRPSASQLLQHERVEFARKVCDTEKLLTSVKLHKSTVAAKEKELQTLAATLAQREASLADVIAQKDAEIQRLSALVGQTDLRIKQAVHAREEELCALVMRREEEVRAAMSRREEEILDAVRKREDEINDSWQKREETMRVELNDAVRWVESRQKELTEEADKIEEARRKLEEETEKLSRSTREVVKEKKTPLEEVKNLLTPYSRLAREEAEDYEENTPRKPSHTNIQRTRSLDTPMAIKCDTTLGLFSAVPGSAMRGVVLTDSGESLKTPAPFARGEAALTKLIKDSPCIDLKFRKLFDFAESESEEESGGADDDLDDVSASGTVATSRSGSSTASERDRDPNLTAEINSPTKHVKARTRSKEAEKSAPLSPSKLARPKASSSTESLPATRSKRQSLQPSLTTITNKPSIASRPTQSAMTRVSRPSLPVGVRRSALPSSTSSVATIVPSESTGAVASKAPVASRKAPPPPTPHYDPSDEENLPSPFLRRADRKNGRVSGTGATIVPSTTAVATAARRKSNLLLRTAAQNSANNLHAVKASS